MEAEDVYLQGFSEQQLLFVSPTSSSKWLRVTQTAVANCYGGDGGHHNACLLPCCSTQDAPLM